MSDWDASLALGWWSPPPERPLIGEGPWVPGSYQLALLSPDAFAPATSDNDRALLQGSLAAIDRYLYLVVDEIIDVQLTAVVLPWPTVGYDGQVLFDASEDPVASTVDIDAFQRFVNFGRGRLRDMGILNATQASRPAAIGDAFAVAWRSTSNGADLFAYQGPALLAIDIGQESGEMLIVGEQRPDAVGLLDVTWDALDVTAAAHSIAVSGAPDVEVALDRAVAEAAGREAFGRP